MTDDAVEKAQLDTVRDLYLTTMIRIIANTIYEDGNINGKRPPAYNADLRAEGRDWPARALSMTGVKRLTNTRMLAERALAENVPGDFIETGVWRGGSCILLRAVLAAHGDTTRSVLVADSFCGLPSPEQTGYAADAGDGHHRRTQLAVPRSEVEAAFRKFDLLDRQVEFLEGWFTQTLPTLGDRRFALIRLDGDMYGSTMDALTHLYPRLSPGGFVIVDDFGAVPNCRAAVEEYRAKHAIDAPMHEIDWTGVWWRKEPTPAMAAGIAAARPSRIACLRDIHAVLNPRSYVEIGSGGGEALSLARCPSLYIDPDLRLAHAPAGPVRLVRMTSEAFFASRGLRRTLAMPSIDLAFLDAPATAPRLLHDFDALERASDAESVILLGRVLPDATADAGAPASEAGRLILLLRAQRPELTIEVFDCAEGGLAIVSGLPDNAYGFHDRLAALQADLAAGAFPLPAPEAARDALAARPPSHLRRHLASLALARAG